LGKSYILIAFFGIILFTSTFAVPPYHHIANHALAQTAGDEVRDIGNYVILGFDETIVEQNVIINSGSVGVQNENAQVTIKEGTTFLDSSSALAGDIVKIEINANAQNVFFNDLILEGSILGSQNTPLVLPLVENFPDLPDVQSGTTSVSVPKDQTETLQPGSYDVIFVDEGATLIFVGGTYNANSIISGLNARLLFDDATEIVTQELKLGDNGVFGPSDSSSITSSGIVVFVHDNTDPLMLFDIEIGKNSILDTTIFSPAGKLLIKQGTQATGAFIAKKVKIEPDSVLTLDSAFNPAKSLIKKYEEIISDLGKISDISDEAILSDYLNNAITSLKTDTQNLVSDPDASQDLIFILDSALEEVTDASEAVLKLDEDEANEKINQVTITVQDYIQKVEDLKVTGDISTGSADILLGAANEISINSMKIGIDAADLITGTPLIITSQIIDRAESDVSKLNMIANELLSLGFTVDIEAETSSPTRGFVRFSNPDTLQEFEIEIISSALAAMATVVIGQNATEQDLEPTIEEVSAILISMAPLISAITINPAVIQSERTVVFFICSTGLRSGQPYIAAVGCGLFIGVNVGFALQQNPEILQQIQEFADSAPENVADALGRLVLPDPLLIVKKQTDPDNEISRPSDFTIPAKYQDWKT